MSRVAEGGPSRPTSRSRPRSSGRRAARRKTERTTASTRAQPVPARASASSRAAASSAAERSMSGLEQRLLGREPVEDGLLAHARGSRPGRRARSPRSRGTRTRPGRRRGCGRPSRPRGVRPALGFSPVHLPYGRQRCVAEVTTPSATPDRAGPDGRRRRPGGHAHPGDGGHRLPRHGAGRAAPALRPGVRGGGAGAAHPPRRRRRPPGTRDPAQRLLRPPARRARRPLRRDGGGPAAGGGRRRRPRRARPRRRGPARAGLVRRGRALRRHRRLRRPPRHRRRGQPARARRAWPPPSSPSPTPRAGATTPDAPPTHLVTRVHRLRGRHPPGRRHRDPRHRGHARPGRGPAPTPPSPPRSTSTPRSPRRGACATTSSPSRARPNGWRSFTKAARAELGAAGTHLLAERAEKLRDDWVRDPARRAGRGPGPGPRLARRLRLHQGPGRARPGRRRTPTCPSPSCGPSIIESALAEPRPGWIRGFRMAEPIIVSYARGLLREFPGVPEGVVDVIPVDLVVAAIIAVAAAGPDPTGPPCTRWPRACGTRCATASSSTWCGRGSPSTRSTTPTASPSWCPSGRSPGAAGCSASCSGPPRPSTTAERVLGALPVRGERADLAARVEERRTQAERALGYAELYGAYTETEAHFRVDRLLALWDRLSPPDRETFCFDPAVISWPDYVHDVHLPSVVEHARVRSSPTPLDRWPAARTAPAAPSCPPSATWPPSTSRTP